MEHITKPRPYNIDRILLTVIMKFFSKGWKFRNEIKQRNCTIPAAKKKSADQLQVFVADLRLVFCTWLMFFFSFVVVVVLFISWQGSDIGVVTVSDPLIFFTLQKIYTFYACQKMKLTTFFKAWGDLLYLPLLNVTPIEILSPIFYLQYLAGPEGLL